MHAPYLEVSRTWAFAPRRKDEAASPRTNAGEQPRYARPLFVGFVHPVSWRQGRQRSGSMPDARARLPGVGKGAYVTILYDGFVAPVSRAAERTTVRPPARSHEGNAGA